MPHALCGLDCKKRGNKQHIDLSMVCKVEIMYYELYDFIAGYSWNTSLELFQFYHTDLPLLDQSVFGLIGLLLYVSGIILKDVDMPDCKYPANVT